MPNPVNDRLSLGGIAVHMFRNNTDPKQTVQVPAPHSQGCLDSLSLSVTRQRRGTVVAIVIEIGDSRRPESQVDYDHDYDNDNEEGRRRKPTSGFIRTRQRAPVSQAMAHSRCQRGSMQRPGAEST